MLNSSYDQAWEILLLSLASKSASAKAQEFKFLNHRPNLLTKKVHGEYKQFQSEKWPKLHTQLLHV
jgi:hypothetical protein